MSELLTGQGLTDDEENEVPSEVHDTLEDVPERQESDAEESSGRGGPYPSGDPRGLRSQRAVVEAQRANLRRRARRHWSAILKGMGMGSHPLAIEVARQAARLEEVILRCEGATKARGMFDGRGVLKGHVKVMLESIDKLLGEARRLLELMESGKLGDRGPSGLEALLIEAGRNGPTLRDLPVMKAEPLPEPAAPRVGPAVKPRAARSTGASVALSVEAPVKPVEPLPALNVVSESTKVAQRHGWFDLGEL